MRPPLHPESHTSFSTGSHCAQEEITTVEGWKHRQDECFEAEQTEEPLAYAARHKPEPRLHPGVPRVFLHQVALQAERHSQQRDNAWSAKYNAEFLQKANQSNSCILHPSSHT